LEEKAEKLLQAGHKVKSAVRLTRREEEVLNGILRSLANKEIASELNLSERTVKFHVSSLLAKFKVRGRMELMRETSRNPIQPVPAAVSSPAPPAQTFASRPRLYGKPMSSRNILPLARPRLMA
jgi:DNA-binding CsgD family transcriptional regulator